MHLALFVFIMLSGSNQAKTFLEEFSSFNKSISTQKMAYKTSVKKFTQQIEEWEQVKKERDLIGKKYDTAKKKLGEAVSSLDEARTTNVHYQQQVSLWKTVFAGGNTIISFHDLIYKSMAVP